MNASFPFKIAGVGHAADDPVRGMKYRVVELSNKGREHSKTETNRVRGLQIVMLKFIVNR